jgi:hypothetical protein
MWLAGPDWRFDSKLRFVQPSAPAGGALSRLHQFVLTERETTGPASRGFHDDRVPARARGSNQVAEIVFDITSGESEIARQR